MKLGEGMGIPIVSIDPRVLRREVARIKELYEQAKQQLETAEESCKHDYTEPLYDPIVHEAFHSPGDSEGTMGVDRQLPMDVPRREVPRWYRECRRCGKEEWTERTREEVKRVPLF